MISRGQEAGALIRIKDIVSLEVPLDGEAAYPANSSYTAVFCLGGRAMIASGSETVELAPNEAYLLRPDRGLRLFAEGEPMTGCLVRFEAYAPATEGHYARAEDFPVGRMRIADPRQAVESCDRLLQWHATGRDNEFRGQAELYRLLALLAEAEAAIPEEETTAGAIARVADFMRQNPHRELSRKELAGLAGLSPGYFSWAFQQYMGQAPFAYWMEIRMEWAEKLLLSGARVRETAAQAGFDDEFYFSRRFKQKTGLSPAAFVKSRKRNIASISEPLSGSLLALRLLPKAAVFYPNHSAYSRMIRLHSDEVGNGQRWETNLELLKKAGPELIFCTDMLAERARRELELIAPTAQIPWLTADWREQLGTIAEAMEQENEAKMWLAEYDRKTEAAYRKVKGRIGGATLNIWRITDSEYRIYGKRNMGAVLYDDLRLAATHKLEETGVFETVALEELERYDADIVMIVVDPTPAASRRKRALQSSELWRQLAAVRSGRVYEIGTEQLFEYSAWSHERALSYLMKLFG